MLNYTVRLIPKEQTHIWLLKKHYAHRIPSISYAYGLFDGKMILQGICTYGSPPSHALVVGILGGEYIDDILELNRLCVNEGLTANSLSYFVSRTLKLLPRIKIIVSYADTSQGHVGYIYQACNFIYTGLSAERTEWYVKGLEQLHSKSLSDGETKESLIAKYGDKLAYRDRARKHRYVYIAADKRQRQIILSKLKYPIVPYPKGDNKRYDASFAPPNQGILI